MARCRVVIRQQPQLAGCTVITEPWPMRVVGVLDDPLYGMRSVILEWYPDGPEQDAGYRWSPGMEPPSFRTLAEVRERIAERRAVQAQADARFGVGR